MKKSTTTTKRAMARNLSSKASRNTVCVATMENDSFLELLSNEIVQAIEIAVNAPTEEERAMEKVKSYIATQTELAVLRGKATRTRRNRRAMENAISSYAALVFMAEALTTEKEVRIAINSSSKGKATLKAPQNNMINKINKIARLFVIKDNAIEALQNRFGVTNIVTNSNSTDEERFTLDRQWDETKVRGFNANNIINSVCRLSNKLYDTINKHGVPQKKNCFILRSQINTKLLSIYNNGEFIKKQNNAMRFMVNYNQITLDTFGVSGNSFEENECRFNRLACRFMSTPVSGANGSASVGANNNNGGTDMKAINEMTVLELKSELKGLEVKGYSKMCKADLVDLLINELTKLNGEIPFRSEEDATNNNIRKMSKKIMSSRYEKQLLVKRFDIDTNKLGEVSVSMCYQNIFGSRIADVFEISDYCGSVVVGEEDDVTGKIASSYEVLVGGESTNKLMKDLVLINVANSDDNPLVKDGFSICEGVDGKYTIAPVTAMSPNKYVFVATSTSMKKKGNFFAGEVTANRTKEDIDNAINDLTGGAYHYQLNILKAKQKKGALVTPAMYAKAFDRLGLLVSTPLVYFGETKNVFLFNDSLDYGEQFAPEVEKALQEMKIFEGNAIDKKWRAFTDGYACVSAKFLIKWAKETFGMKLSYKQAMMFLPQARATVIAKKGLDRVFDSSMMFGKAYNVIGSLDYSKFDPSKDTDPIFVSCNGVNHAGFELWSMIQSGNLGYVKDFLRQIDIMCTKDEAKMINWNALSAYDKNHPDYSNAPAIEYYLVNLPLASNAKYSTQMINKVAVDYPEETKAFMEFLAKDDMYANENKENTELRFDKNGGLGNTIENLYAVNYDRALTDKLVGTSNITDLEKYGISKVSKANIPSGAHYLYLTPFDSALVGFELPESLRSKEVEYINEDGEVIKTKVNVIYSPTLDKEAKAKISDIYSDDTKTKREKELLANSIRVAIALKMPTQGADEYTPGYIISYKELMTEIDKLNADEFSKRQMKKFVKYCPYGAIMLFCDATMLVQDAGSDLDGDAMIVVVNSLSVEETDDNFKLHLGIWDDENKKPIIGYVSLLIRKYMEKGSICTAISRYDLEKEIKKQINKEKAEAKINSKHRKTNNKFSSAKNFRQNKEKTAKSENQKTTEANWKELIKKGIMSSKIFMGIPFLSYDIDMSDNLCLYQASTVFGNEVGMSVTLSSIIVSMPEEVMFKEDGSFNFDLASRIFVPIQEAIKDGTRKDEKYYTVFTENVNCGVYVNTSGIVRAYFRMSNEEICEMYNRIANLSEFTTREEWKALQSDFSHLGRNLGETSIDIAKDVTIANSYTIHDFINKQFRLVGQMKSGHIKSNIYNLLSNNENEYSIDYGKYVVEGSETVLPDLFGQIKHSIGSIYSEEITEMVKQVRDINFYNYFSYDQYSEFNCSMSLYNMCENMLNYVVDHHNPSYGLSKIDKDMFRLFEKALVNTSSYLGYDKADIIKAMIKVAFTGVYGNGVTNEIQHVFDSTKEYNTKIKYVTKLFPEIFLMEYRGENNHNPLKVKVGYDVCTATLPKNTPIKLTNGWNKENTFHAENDYTGLVIATDEGVYALYNPYKSVESDYVVIPVSEFAAPGQRSANFETGEYGKDFIENNNSLRLVNRKIKDNPDFSNEVIITNEDKTEILARSLYFNTSDFAGKFLDNCRVFSYTCTKQQGKKDIEVTNSFIIGTIR